MYRKTVLDNGITIVTETHPHARATAVGAWVINGTRDESKDVMGISHFVEHMVFKGTKNRNAFEIARSIEAVGGDLNAYTTREYTCFHATTLKDHLALSVDVLGDIVCNARFSMRDFERERNVILQEIAMTEDNYEEYVYDAFFEKIYGDAALGWPILGTQDTISQMKKTTLQGFYRGRYRPENLIVSAAGPLKHSEVVRLVRESFTFRPLDNKWKQRPSRRKPNFYPLKEVITKDGEQVHVLVGFPGVSFMDERRFAAFVLNAWLGGGMTSKLYQAIRERRGLAYTVYSNLTTFTDCGTLTVYAGTDQKGLPQVMEAINKNIKAARREKMSDRALDLFIQQVRGGILLGSDDMENRMSSLGVNEMVFERYMPVQAVLAGLKAVKAKDVKELARELLDPEKMAVFILGPVDKNKTLSMIE